jgi:hypothetical protein
MNSRLLRPRASGVHPEAAAWRTAVIANGGTVSASTMKAVSTFCRAIELAGIRDRFYRLSLMCGNNLLAAQVPLYRSQSFGGTPRGNSIDINVGSTLFSSSDYTESTGLQCGGDTKLAALECAPRPISNMFPVGNDRQTGHLSAMYVGATASIRTPIGITGGASGAYIIQNSTTTSRGHNWGTRGVSRTATSGVEHAINRRDSSGVHALYVNGASVGTSTGSSTTDDLDARFVVGGQGDTSPTNNISGVFFGRVFAYSFGATMDDAQALAFYNALNTFCTTIGRVA